MDYKVTQDKKLITVKEFATLYGIGMNKSYEIVNNEKFPKVKVGKKYLIIKDKVDNFLECNIGVEF